MKKKLTILLSAYACEPNKGSEPEVGWQWANALSKLGHNVHVITRANNKVNIEKNIKKHKNLNFIYYDLSPIFIKLFSRRKKKKFFFLFLFLFLAVRNIFSFKTILKKN